MGPPWRMVRTITARSSLDKTTRHHKRGLQLIDDPHAVSVQSMVNKPRAWPVRKPNIVSNLQTVRAASIPAVAPISLHMDAEVTHTNPMARTLKGLTVRLGAPPHITSVQGTHFHMRAMPREACPQEESHNDQHDQHVFFRAPHVQQPHL